MGNGFSLEDLHLRIEQLVVSGDPALFIQPAEVVGAAGGVDDLRLDI